MSQRRQRNQNELGDGMAALQVGGVVTLSGGIPEVEEEEGKEEEAGVLQGCLAQD